MANSLLKHKGCGGNVFVDVSVMIRFTTPGIGITPEGIVIPVLEVQGKTSDKKPNFFCSKCQQEFSLKEAKSEIVVECLACHELKEVSDCYSAYQLPIICDDCKSVCTSKKAAKSPKQAKLSQYLNLEAGDVTFVPLSDVLKTVRL